ncbi:MAG: hypothetical protein AB1714_13595 [Acidobacteriota bacterium]
MMTSFPERHERIFIWQPRYMLFILFPTFLALLLSIIYHSSAPVLDIDEDSWDYLPASPAWAQAVQESTPEALKALSETSRTFRI